MEICELKKHIDFADKIGFKGLIGKSPEQVAKYFKDKKLVKSESWTDFETIQAPNIFSVAGITKLDILQDVQDLLWQAIENGTSVEDFKKSIEDKLIQRGYVAGKIEIKDQSILADAWRLNLIYRQNIQSAYQAGRYKQMTDNRFYRPYWRYVGILDGNTRPGHAAIQEWFVDKVALATDPMWSEIYPPNGFNCRCSVDALNHQTVMQLGLTVAKIPPSLARYVDKGFKSNPAKKFFTPDFSQYDSELKAPIRDLKAEVQAAAEKVASVIHVKYSEVI